MPVGSPRTRSARASPPPKWRSASSLHSPSLNPPDSLLLGKGRVGYFTGHPIGLFLMSATTAGTDRQGMNTFRRLFTRLEIDERLLGMVASLIVIWVGFHILSDGKFITPRNLYNLSTQTA